MIKRSLRILITAGPTRERIDLVRFLSNYSTGSMGARLAAEALARGHRVTVVCGPGTRPMPQRARVVPIESAQDLERTLRRLAPAADVLMMAAAIADFRPTRTTFAKLPRRSTLVLRLRATPDIIGRLPRHHHQLVVGFAVERRGLLARASEKLRSKRLDVLLAQRINGEGAPFGPGPVRAWLLTRDGAVTKLGRISKARVARVLLDKVEGLWYGQTHEPASTST